jgi:hypothetical protein
MQLNESDAYAITHTHIQINTYLHAHSYSMDKYTKSDAIYT